MRPEERRDVQVGGLVLTLAAVLAAIVFRPALGVLALVPVVLAGHWFGPRAAVRIGAGAAVAVAAAAVAGPRPHLPALAAAPLLPLAGHVFGRLLDDRRRALAELERLRPIQDTLAPADPPELPLLEVATSYLPAERGVAGDFYLIAEGRNGATIIAVGDVVGKGLNAARRASFVRATLTAAAPYTDDPVELLRLANGELVHGHDVSPDIVTVVCAVVRPDGSVSWSTAGHPPPLRIADGAPLGEARPAYPLGIAPEISPERVDTVLPEGGMLLHTDGLTDARPPGGRYEPFGYRRLRRLLSELDDPRPQQAVASLVHAVERFSRGALPDDLCLVAIRSKLPRYAGRPEPQPVPADRAA